MGNTQSKIQHSSEDFFKSMLNDVSVFYDGFSLTIPRDMLRGVMNRLREQGYQADLTTEQIQKQMADLCKRLSQSHADKADLNDEAAYHRYFGNDLKSVVHLSIVWSMNVATLLHRKVIKNDDQNGWLSFRMLAGR